QMQGPRPYDEGRRLVVQAMIAAVGIGEGELPLDRVVQVLLALDYVLPGRCVGGLEVGHVDGCARVESVDHHLAVGRPGDLDIAHSKVMRYVGDAPVQLPHVTCVVQEVERSAASQLLPAFSAGKKQLLPDRLDLAM